MNLVTLVLACSLYADNSIPYAMIQTGNGNNPLIVTVNHVTKHFKKTSEAIRYTQQQITQGKTVDIGLMQISSQWLPEFSTPADLFRPCKNLVVATQIMNKLLLQCQTLAERNPMLNIQSCMLSLYKTGNAQTGFTYANQIIDYAAKHPFSVLAEKARDPGMLAAVAKPNAESPPDKNLSLTTHTTKPS